MKSGEAVGGQPLLIWTNNLGSSQILIQPLFIRVPDGAR